MSIEVGGNGGGAGEFIASRSYSVEVIAAGATGTFKTLTPPTGKRIKIQYLRPITDQTNLLTITRGGVDVVSLVKLDSGTTLSGANEYLLRDGMNTIVGEVDEAIQLKTNVGLSSDIHLMYQEGDFKS